MAKTGRMLLVSSDDACVEHVRRACEVARLALDVAATPAAANLDATDVVICDDADFAALRCHRTMASAIVVGSAADSSAAIEAIKQGAFEYGPLPTSVDDLAHLLRAALRVARDTQRPATYESPPDRAADVDRIIGQSPAMQDVYKAIGRIAPRDINVLITGESGTGKELVARAILHHSRRRDAPYLAVNCAAIPETLLESELFGHERGAFTGADRRHVGKFEQCDGGTIFLDEVGDIPPSIQAKLLRVLQDQTFQRVGGVETVRADVRIIAATHQPLEQLISERRFRADLYYRLSVANLHVPPLRDREVDVVLLAHEFVDRYNADYDTHIRAFAPETLRLLLQHDWPGNVRELENVIRATLVMSRGPVLRPEFLPESIRHRGASPSVEPPASPPPERASEPSDDTATLAAIAEACLADAGGSGLPGAVAALEREVIRVALRRHGGRVAPAARALKISRATLRRKMDAHGIDITTT
ncbi:MAG: sigma-54-dependent Fis family transcriptional regulator [Phycisphaerales bacterium]|nr:sigma-54-dependent Fis family transcriptional regulator [Phycisphaerales bacterium]NNM27504.1 sigma-54-dependent Fis family transcriptional regulator [Phycisphaerales bacterium]